MDEMEDLVINNHLSDITIYVGPDKTNAWIFPAHQHTLSLSSPVFTAMFSGVFAESKKEVTIEDISPHTFYKVLIYVYKGVLEVKSLSEAFSILKAADKYQMDKLKAKCTASLQQYPITWEVFWDFLTDISNSCDQLVPFELKLNIFIFLDENAHDVLMDQNFLFLSRETVTMIVSRNTLVVSELILCNSLLKWAKMQCYRQNILPSPENQRQVLHDLLHTMRLSNINNKEIFSSPIYKILMDEEKELVMMDPCELPKPWTLNTPIRGTDCRKLTHERLKTEESTRSKIQSPVYMVFGQDAFVHQMSFMAPYKIQKLDISALSEQGVKTHVKLGPPMTDFHVKAFVCYILEYELSNSGLRYSFDPKFVQYSSWGFETGTDRAVLFSAHNLGDAKYKDFLSSEYWKRMFSTREPARSDLGTNVYDVVATFC